MKRSAMVPALAFFAAMVSSAISGSKASAATTLTCTGLLSDTLTHSVPTVSKPAYLVPTTDPVFGTKVTRITGDPGTAISGVSGGVWGNIVHHQYSKVQAWNADQSLMFIETNKGGGGTGSVFLDGRTYQPLFRRSCPGNECRWHMTDSSKMFYAGGGGAGNQIGYWTVATGSTSVIATLTGYSDLTIGEYEGNLNSDGSKVVLMGTDSSSHSVAFIYDLSTSTKSADIDFTALGIDADNVSLSAKSNYVVVNDNSDRITVFDLSGNIVNQFTEYGRPSHYDMAVDQYGDEVVVGVSKSSPDTGKVISRRLSDGAVSVIVGSAYASHTSTRSTQLGSWGLSTYDNNPSNPPYSAELVAYSVDGSKIYRLAHHHGNNTDYEAEVHGSLSPDGLRVVFASNWDESSGRPVQVYVVDISGNCDTTAPTVPTGLGATAISSSRIDLSWTASTDDVAVTGYRIFRNGVPLTTVAGTSYSDTGLTASTAYSYTVSAYDGAGNESAQSTSASATTLSAPPVNLVTNPGFESQLTNWQTWGNSSAVTSNVYAGTYAVRVGKGDGGVYQNVASKLTVGGTYKLTAYGKLGSSSDPSGTVGIEFMDSSGGVISEFYANIPSTTYQQVSVNFTYPAGVSQALIYVWKNSGSSYVYVDNFELKTNP